MLVRITFLMLALVALAPVAGSAGSLVGARGSILIFPLLDSTGERVTKVTITNTNADETVCGSFRRGDVLVVFRYVDATTWEGVEREEILSPCDTITVIAKAHSGGVESGYLLVHAADPESELAIDFDFLLGSASVLDLAIDSKWTYLPYGFEAFPNDDPPFQTDACGRGVTDNFATLTTFDFDDFEYSAFPETLYLDHLEGEGSPPSTPALFENSLCLMSTSPDPSTVFLLGWNNNEARFSQSFGLECWEVNSLVEISPMFRTTELAANSDPGEFAGIPTGWANLRSGTPNVGLLGVYVPSVRLGARRFVSARALQTSGSRNVTLPRLP